MEFNNDLRSGLLWAYRLILNREPEGEHCLEPTDGDDAGSIRARFFRSAEYQNFVKTRRVISNLAERSANNLKPRHLLLQTADSLKYRELLFASARYNSHWAASANWEHRLHIGSYVPFHPYQATLNRIFLLNELVDSGFKGWVLYIDADNLLITPPPSHAELAERASSGKVFWFFNHHRREDPEFNFFNINAGAFGIFVGDPTSNEVIKSWGRFYEHNYDAAFLQSASAWGDIVNDQQSLQLILEAFSDAFDLPRRIHMDFLYGGFVQSCGRGEENPGENDLSRRLNEVRDYGRHFYGF